MNEKQLKTEDRVRVLRVLEYEGPRSVIEDILKRSIHGEKIVNGGNVFIRAATLGLFPEILKQEKDNGREERSIG